MKDARVRDLMVKHPVLIAPQATLKEAAVKMRDVDCGVLPVGTKSDLKGIITDRDIVIRAVSGGKDPAKETVEHYMTTQAYFCREDDTLKEAAEIMKRGEVTRLLVKDPSGRVSGIISFGSILRNDVSAEDIAAVVERVADKKVA